MDKYISFLKEGGADQAIVIDAKSIVTAAWTVYKCKYGCASYGKTRCCPPHAPTWKQTQEMIDCYKTAILFCSHDKSVITPLAIEASGIMFLDDYYKAMAFGCGSCRKCQTCNLETCNLPGKAVPSMEACGLDVFATARANGLEIHTLRTRDEQPNYFGLLLVE